MIAAASALASRFAVATALDRIAPARVDARAPRRAVIECAHKKGTGSTKNGRDSNPQYLGVKKYGEEKVQVGSIIVRQRGNKVRARRARARESASRGREATRATLGFRVSANASKAGSSDARRRREGRRTR